MIKQLELTNYRQFSKLKLNLDEKVLIIGKNTLGKTSILEAISVLCLTKSHQTKNLLDVVKYDEQYGLVSGILDDKNEYKIVISKKGKSILYNKKEVKLLSDYIGTIPVLFFSPSDMNLIKGSPNLRRNFLNINLSQLDKIYIKELNIYNELLKERNTLLKQSEINFNLLDVITKQMIEVSKKIIKKRQEFVDEINKYINKVQNKLMIDEKIYISYISNLNIDKMEEDFKNHLETDIKNKQTEIGIQRDDLVFYINDKDTSKFASLGQIKSVILSTYITLTVIYKKRFDNYPILLLDDVFGELDKYRMNNLLKVINNLGQVIISTISLEEIDKELLKNYQIINLGE